MSFEGELQRIKDEIIQNLPPEITVHKIEFEGPEIAVYSENSDVETTENSTVLKDLAKTMRKRVVFRWNVDKRKDPAETEAYIRNLVDEDLIPIVESIIPFCKKLKKYIVITEKNLDELETKLEPLYSYEELLKEASPYYDWPYLDENSAYGACYTTGTTGKPKGVYYSHRYVYLQAIAFTAQMSMDPNDVVLQLVPMFHVLGWSKPQAAVYAGSKLVFSGKWSLDDLEEITHLMVQEKVTISGGVPAVFMAMLEIIRKMDQKPDLSNTRLICGGAEPPIALMRGFWDETGGEIIHSYGSTEAMAITTLNFFKPWLKKELNEEELWDLKKKQGTIVSGLDIEMQETAFLGSHPLRFPLPGRWRSKRCRFRPRSPGPPSRSGRPRS